jgi:threonine synthase
MDIQVSSNLERLLFESMGRDGAAVAQMMADFRTDGTVSVPTGLLDGLRAEFDCGRVSDAQAARVIKRVYGSTGLLVDPHTAIGIGVAEEHGGDPSVPMVALGTAHPAKFPDAVEDAVGVRPPLPAHLSDLFERTEHIEHCDATLDAVEAHVRAGLAAR